MISKQTLYSLDKKGNRISWTITWDTESNWYTMTSGRLDGAQTETEPTYCKGKNPGKKNETTDVQQWIAGHNQTKAKASGGSGRGREVSSP